MTQIIRSAKLTDQRVLCDLYRQLHPADPAWPSEAAAAEALSHVLGHEGTTILLGEVGAVAVSTGMLVICRNFSRCGRPFALIENVVTDRQHRKRGYGRKLVEHAIDLARQQGCYRVTLMTGSRREETLRFYEAAGLRRNTKTAFEARFAEPAPLLSPRSAFLPFAWLAASPAACWVGERSRLSSRLFALLTRRRPLLERR